MVIDIGPRFKTPIQSRPQQQGGMNAPINGAGGIPIPRSGSKAPPCCSASGFRVRLPQLRPWGRPPPPSPSVTDKFGRTTFWLPPVGAGKLSGLEIEIAPARVFRSRDGREGTRSRSFPPQTPGAWPPSRLWPKKNRSTGPSNVHESTLASWRPQPQIQRTPRRCSTCCQANISDGAMPRRPSTACHALFSSWFQPARMESQQRTRKRRHNGHFLEGNITAIGGIEALQKAHAPLLCCLGTERTTSQKKKDHLATIVAVCFVDAV